MKLAVLVSLSCLLSLASVSVRAVEPESGSPYAAWSAGPDTDENFFPIAVWAQNPRNAAKYKAAGVNVYVSLPGGPTAEQVAQLKAAGIRTVCRLNDYAREHLDDPVFIAWMHGDEPDNADKIETSWKNDRAEIKRQWPEYSDQQIAAMGMWGPGRGPDKIHEDYLRIKRLDPTRPVLLNLGQSVAYTDWVGRGPRSGHTEDYPRYVHGGDIVSFDIYPANHSVAKYRGQLWYVPFGVSRLHTWSEGGKIIWQCVEASPIHLDGPDTEASAGRLRRDHVPTGREIRNEVWASIIHGSRGIIYFCHQFTPKFNDHFPLTDETLRKEFTAINHEVQALAPAINAPTIDNLATVWFANPKVPVKALAKSLDGYVYLFAAAMRDGRTRARFTVYGIAEDAEVEVIGEDRTITCEGRSFSDEFRDWDVHLYKIKADGFEGFSK